jgi:flavin reductase (DIM6/NTAB) family NADH-FMN oxidoreductase RutF
VKIDPASLSPGDAYRLQIACIAPRPIAFVTTLSKSGATNLAPFSYFNGVSSDPPVLSIAVSTKRDGSKKDTWRNAEETGELVVNVVTPALMDSVITAARELPHGESEIDLSGEPTLPCEKVKPPRLARSPISMECSVLKIVEVEDTGLILGRVLMYHLDDGVLDAKGRPDPAKVGFVARLGGDSYARLGELFERKRT